jgi:1,2-diacylglycerol 3-beta-galactosyltransferase
MSSVKKILILTADAGFGHRAAANAIAAALAERYQEVCQIDVINPLENPHTPGLLRRTQTDYDRLMREVPEIYDVTYRASDSSVPVSVLEQALIAMLHATMRDVLLRYAPDAIVSTYPLYQAPLASNFALSRRYVPLLTVVTDLSTVHGAWFNDEIDRLMVPTPEVRQKAIDHGISPDRVEVTGIPVNPLLARPVDRQQLRAKLGWPEGRWVALCAGSKRVSRIRSTVNLLNHSGLPLALALIAGGDPGLAEEWAATRWHLPAFRYSFVENMSEMMLASDFIICKAGGLIISEALAAGLPILMTEALPGQEIGNAQHVQREGAGTLAGSPSDALITAFHWLDDGGRELAAVAARSRALGRPDASYRAADLAWLAAQRGCQVREHRLLDQVPFLREILSIQPKEDARP